MNDRINKTSICSIVFLDIIDYSKKPDSEQIEVKNQFNDFINIALKDIAQNDRIILDTGDGAAIAYMGSPEDALFMALNIRDGILKNNEAGQSLMHVRFGINLGPVRVVKDINGRPNIIGDGINVAQRIMSFAQPNQILVSRSYYEITSRLTQEISQMFDYSGVKHDKHVRDHEVYSVRSTKGADAVENHTDEIADNFPLTNPLAGLSFAGLNKINWNYAAPAIFVLVTLFAISKLAFAPNEPANIANIATKPATVAVVAPIKPAVAEVVAPTKPAKEVLANNAPVNKTLEQKKASQKLAMKKAKLKAKKSPESAPQHTDIAQNPNTSKEQTTKIADSKTVQAKPSHGTVNTRVISTPESKCSQAQTAMGQCN
jgi:Adenylate and Guanylate cyclase catalytic domain